MFALNKIFEGYNIVSATFLDGNTESDTLTNSYIIAAKNKSLSKI